LQRESDPVAAAYDRRNAALRISAVSFQLSAPTALWLPSSILRPPTLIPLNNPFDLIASLPMTLLQERDLKRRQRRLQVHEETRLRLKEALAELTPGRRVIVFGSLTRPGVFNDRSDVDLALEEEPPHMNIWQLTGELMERLGRPVDVVLLKECCFRDKVIREGEQWTL